MNFLEQKSLVGETWKMRGKAQGQSGKPLGKNEPRGSRGKVDKALTRGVAANCAGGKKVREFNGDISPCIRSPRRLKRTLIRRVHEMARKFNTQWLASTNCPAYLCNIACRHRHRPGLFGGIGTTNLFIHHPN
jgi:hypothetical protein